MGVLHGEKEMSNQEDIKKPILSPKDRPVHKTNLTKIEDRSHISEHKNKN